MQACIFPLELCEAIIGAVPSGIMDSWPVPYKQKDWSRPYDVLSLEQSTLQSCSLTCRAWRQRSQALLWKRPTLTIPMHVSNFYESIREDSVSERQRLVSELYMVSYKSTAPAPITLRANYAMHSFPNLRVLHTRHVDWLHYILDRSGEGIPIHLARAHLPFFSNLVCLECHTDAAAVKRLSHIREQRGACEKLRSVLIHTTDIFIPKNAYLGTLLGTSITVVEVLLELHMIETSPWTRLPPLIWLRSLPCLREVHLVLSWHAVNQEQSTMEMLCKNIGHHPLLQKIIVINTGHLADLSPGETPEDMWLGRTFPLREDPDNPLTSVMGSPRR
ncbi:hypothetical protein NUW54_g9440 [Trametes sanguinea]|uniref:Uncharacterized protein n=1 Tax=Trametes sanguinea TaxID=158606 RepID=A0ACC1P5Y2_9APHY|nr:hypothetical protein NUW54_g9440 [Trametes sanguinea]